MQDLFGQPAADAGDWNRLCELSIDAGHPSGAKLGDATRALLRERRRGRAVWPTCYTAVQGSHAASYFSSLFVEDRVPPSGPSYHEFLTAVQRGLSIR